MFENETNDDGKSNLEDRLIWVSSLSADCVREHLRKSGRRDARFGCLLKYNICIGQSSKWTLYTLFFNLKSQAALINKIKDPFTRD